MDCPICSFKVADQRGLAGHFRHQAATHPDYTQWQEDQRFDGKAEGQDFVVCLECGHRAETLARHLKAAHGITANDYRAKHGDVPIRCDKTTTARREAITAGRASPAYAGTKAVACPSCGQAWQAPKHLGSLHDHRCLPCKQRENLEATEVLWAGKTEFDDYVVCLDCGYKADNLNSHIMSAHPTYRNQYPDAPVVALRSALRDKRALKGLRRSADFKRRVSEAKTLGLTLQDFSVFLEPDGTVDHRTMSEILGYAPLTLKRYMDQLGLVPTHKYIDKRGFDKRMTIPAEDLLKYALGNGKISVAAATTGLGYSAPTIKKECLRLGLPWAHGNVLQKSCLEAVSKALGGAAYQEEWRSDRFRNPLTGHRFRFDGYFPSLGLVVEFHGHQHFTFPNAFLRGEESRAVWEAMRERDRIKQALIEAAPDLTYFMVREDEPYTDPDYLRQRLLALGVG